MSATEYNDEEMVILEDDYCFYTDADTICTICQAEFLDPDDLTIYLHQIHKVTNSNAKFCQFCTTLYTDLIKYAEHLRDKHVVSLNYCAHCLRAFIDADQARTHQRGHKTFKKSEYNCTQCKMTFTHVTDLRKHDFKEHNNDNDGVMMQGFFPYLSAVMKIKAETLLQSIDVETIYICVGCEYSASTMSSFLEHAKSEKCQVYVCNDCSNVYKKKNYIRRHMKNCNKLMSLKNVKCPECHLVFNKYSYLLHKKKCKIIKCYSCNINFSSMYELSEHQSNDHPLSVELKACSFCWKQCVGNVGLQKHIERSHKPELHLYKYLCIYCKTPFKHPQKLFGHFYSRHKDIEPYTCKICDLKFRVRKKLTLHIKLKHNSVGFVEFDENYHVFFTDKKPEKPFIPKSIYADEIEKQKKGTTIEKSEDSSSIELLNLNSEMSVTETEGNQTEVESTPKPTLKRKRATKVKNDIETISLQSSDDDEPLLVVKKRAQKSIPRIYHNKRSKKKLTSLNKQRFTCNICNKYCYTYQNYNHHISLHSSKEYKKCIKCSKVFRSKEKLNKHIANEHSTSKLTETLKHLIEKRKTGGSLADDLPISERFRRTIKKVECVESMSMATITPVKNKLSTFIENFMPEGDSKSEMQVNYAVTCSLVKGHFREPKIKMTKFEAKPTPSVVKLKMPVKFKACNYFEKTIASIRMVQQVSLFNEDNEDSSVNDYNDQYEDDMDHNDSIPEVAEEVMLEGTEETPKPAVIPHKIVIPKLPAEYKDIRIAHLLPEAPFYKIVKVNEVLKTNEQIETRTAERNEIGNGNTIKLADGTKLVTANPLAHLLGKTPIEQVLEPTKNKYYKPKVKNFQGMLVEALSKLDKPTPKRVRKRKVGVAESEASDTVSVSLASEKDTASVTSGRNCVLQDI